MTSPVPTTDPLFPSRWVDLAETICARYYAEFPDHDARYGTRGRAFCAHDNAYLVAWLVDALDTAGPASFETNVTWLRTLLEARGFPMEAFSRNLGFVGDAVATIRPDDRAKIDDLIAGVAGVAGTEAT